MTCVTLRQREIVVIGNMIQKILKLALVCILCAGLVTGIVLILQ